jgi:hypothetical protein
MQISKFGVRRQSTAATALWIVKLEIQSGVALTLAAALQNLQFSIFNRECFSKLCPLTF